MNVVSDPRAHQVEAAYRAQHLSEDIGLEVVDEWVVLEHHWQPWILSEKGVPDIRSRPRDAPDRDTHRRFGRHPDLQIGSPVAGVDELEALEQPVT